MKTLAMLGLSMLVGACGAETTSTGTQQAGLHLDTHTSIALVGTFDDGVAHFAFRGEETASNVVRVSISTGPRTFTIDMDYNTGVMSATAEQTAFAQEELDAFSALDAELAVMVSDHMTPVERVLTGWTTLMTQAVPGLVWKDQQATAARSVTNISPENYCRVLYGDSGHGYCTPYKMTGKNSPNCKGRCGAGCGTARTGGNNQWTQDCAEHDYVIAPWTDCSDDVLTASQQYSVGAGEFCAGNCPNCADGC